MNNATGKIYVTKNYDVFRSLTGNREVTEKHKKEIIKSINALGYISSPIIVNERMEVIDGQHRLAALQELGLPVEYIIARGADASDCAKLNNASKNWSTIDYIKSHASMGNGNYKLLLCLIQAHPRLRLRELIGLASTPVRFNAGVRKDIMDGTYTLSREHYDWAEHVASSYEPFIDLINAINSYKDSVKAAVMFILTIPGVDAARLHRVLSRQRDLRTNGTIESGIEAISLLYNNKLRIGRIDFAEAWKTKSHLVKLAKIWETQAAAWQRVIGC